MKPLLIISLVAIFGAVGLQFVKTLGDLKESRVKREEKNRDTKQKNDERLAIIKELGPDGETSLYAQFTAEMNKSKDLRFQTNQLKSDKTKTDGQAKSTEDQIKAVGDEKTQIEQKIAEIIGKIGSSLEELTARLESLKTDNETKTTELEAAKKELAEIQTQVAAADAKEAALRKQQADRDKAISLSARSGTITSVNPDWSFCVINLGQKDGVTSDSRLIVRRGGQYVGRLNVIQINPRQTVADIDTKSIQAGSGGGVQPGDQVIFDTSVQ